MNYLIGGMPRSGKSELTKMIQEQLNCSVFGTDDLVELFDVITPEYGLLKNSSLNIKLSKIRPIIIHLLERFKYHNKNLIIEGWLIRPEDIDSYLKIDPNLKVVFVGCANITTEEKLANCHKFPNSNDWLLQLPKEEQVSNISESIEESIKIQELCKRLDLLYCDTSYNFRFNLKTAVNSLCKN